MFWTLEHQILIIEYSNVHTKYCMGQQLLCWSITDWLPIISKAGIESKWKSKKQNKKTVWSNLDTNIPKTETWYNSSFKFDFSIGIIMYPTENATQNLNIKENY